MTDTTELDCLIGHAQRLGAVVTVTFENNNEGYRLYETIQVVGLPGVGPLPMSPISAAEALRRANHLEQNRRSNG